MMRYDPEHPSLWGTDVGAVQTEAEVGTRVDLVRTSVAPTGEDLKQEGIARVLSVGDVWMGPAEGLIRHLAQLGSTFTVETVTNVLGLPDTRNALGALVNRLGRQGVIEKTGEYVKSSRPERHAGLIAVWRGAQ